MVTSGGGAKRLRKFRPPLLIVGAYLVVWTGLDLVAMQFEAAPDVSVWYPPAGLDLVVLLGFGLRYALALPLTTIIHSTLVNSVGLTARDVVVLGVLTAVVHVVVAAVLLRGVRFDPRLPSQRDVVWFVWLGCIVGPFALALAEVGVLTAARVVPVSEFLVSVAGLWAGTATGVGTLTPFLLVAARRRRRLWPDLPPLEHRTLSFPKWRGEQAAQTLLLLAAVWASYGRPAGGSLDYTYLVYVPLIWVAVRGGFAAATVAVLLVNVGAVLANGARLPGRGGITLQFGLVTLTLAGLLLGALISQRRADADRHRHDAVHDPLTDLPNRLLFTDRLEQAAGRADRHPERSFAVLFLDLDRFKTINDSLGHRAGDKLLVEVGRRLGAATRPSDSVARLGGDEFAVLVEDLTDARELVQVAERVIDALERPYQLTEGEVVVRASIGSALNRPGLAHPGELLRDADVALHRAKNQGHARHVVFDRDMHRQAVAALRLETELRRAIERDELDVVFQPIVAVPDGGLVAAEALARWTLDGAPVAPCEFITIAEESGLIAGLGERVLRRACAAASAWEGADGSRLRLAVNVSPSELRRPDYARRLEQVLRETGFAPARLSLEITETEWMNPAEADGDMFNQISALGVRLVIDDFGTGYSSFGSLRNIPVSELKIDRSFVAGLPGHADNAAIVEAILAMAAKLQLNVTAEGVESQEQLKFLVQRQCPQAQGYLLGEPTVRMN